MGIRELLEYRREEILQVAAKHGARNLRVFGSVARGDAGQESDIDFLVDVAPAHSSWFPAGLLLDLEDLLGRPVHVVTEAALHRRIRNRVLQEAVAL